MAGDTRKAILMVENLKVYFFTRRGVGRAVDGATFKLNQGETLGLVGESGCGKSITALTVLGLLPQGARVMGGNILFQGEDLLQKSPKEMRRYRGRHICMILQDPLTALNPVLTVSYQLGEPVRLHQQLRGHRVKERIIELLNMLRIPAPEQRLNSYPHQFSGGMRQRVVGAIGISCSPEVLIADEPTTALDVTVQAAYLALLKDIQRQTGVSILFITHDFAVVARMCDQVAVMYAGRIIEKAPTLRLLERPAHPYTEALLNSVPDVRLGTTRLATIDGAPPSIYQLPRGCPFAARCQSVMDRCRQEYPPEVRVAEEQTVRCWRCV